MKDPIMSITYGYNGDGKAWVCFRREKRGAKTYRKMSTRSIWRLVSLITVVMNYKRTTHRLILIPEGWTYITPIR